VETDLMEHDLKDEGARLTLDGGQVGVEVEPFSINTVRVGYNVRGDGFWQAQKYGVGFVSGAGFLRRAKADRTGSHRLLRKVRMQLKRTSGAKAPIATKALAARLKPCP
jgi:hypothetical protein